MSLRKPGIPITSFADGNLNQVIASIKENIEIINGARVGVGEFVKLPTDADLSEIISKINEIITRLNVSGR
jgi:hypothetical protein